MMTSSQTAVEQGNTRMAGRLVKRLRRLISGHAAVRKCVLCARGDSCFRTAVTTFHAARGETTSTAGPETGVRKEQRHQQISERRSVRCRAQACRGAREQALGRAVSLACQILGCVDVPASDIGRHQAPHRKSRGERRDQAPHGSESGAWRRCSATALLADLSAF